MITGDINCGKTTALIEMYKKNRWGDGFALPKFFISGKPAGQNITRLSTTEQKIFSFTDGFEYKRQSVSFRYRNYHFTETGLTFAYEIADEIMKKNINPVYIDEIGPIEIMKKGFYPIILSMLDLKRDLFLVVRSSCCKDVVNLFQITPDHIIALSKIQ